MKRDLHYSIIYTDIVTLYDCECNLYKINYNQKKNCEQIRAVKKIPDRILLVKFSLPFQTWPYDFPVFTLPPEYFPLIRQSLCVASNSIDFILIVWECTGTQTSTGSCTGLRTGVRTPASWILPHMESGCTCMFNSGEKRVIMHENYPAAIMRS